MHFSSLDFETHKSFLTFGLHPPRARAFQSFGSGPDPAILPIFQKNAQPIDNNTQTPPFHIWQHSPLATLDTNNSLLKEEEEESLFFPFFLSFWAEVTIETFPMI